MPYYERLILYFDGASRHNPRECALKLDKHDIYILQLIISLLDGPAGCGWALYEMDDNGAKADVSLFFCSLSSSNSLCAKV
jgi:ribonuclease HI